MSGRFHPLLPLFAFIGLISLLNAVGMRDYEVVTLLINAGSFICISYQDLWPRSDDKERNDTIINIGLIGGALIGIYIFTNNSGLIGLIAFEVATFIVTTLVVLFFTLFGTIEWSSFFSWCFKGMLLRNITVHLKQGIKAEMRQLLLIMGVVLAIYYISSPYQNCIRQNKYGNNVQGISMCNRITKW